MARPIGTPGALHPDTLYTAAEVAAYLRVTVRTVRRLACLRRAVLRIGGSVRYRGEDVLLCLSQTGRAAA